MNAVATELWNKLERAGLVSGDRPATPPGESPWYVRLLLAISGWLASLFFLGFFGAAISSLFRNETVALTVGALLIGGACVLLKAGKNEFIEHAALAFSFTGQFLVIYAIFHWTGGYLGWLIAALFELGLALLITNAIHTTASALVATVCFSTSLTLLGVPYIADSIAIFAAAWLWLHEFDYPQRMRKMKALGYGFILGTIQFKGTNIYAFFLIGWNSRGFKGEHWVQPWMGDLLLGAITLYVIWQILKRLGYRLKQPLTLAALGSGALLTLASVAAHGITIGLLILLLGFSAGNRVLMGLGVTALLYYLSAYYYLLQTTLLVKAGTLLVIGLVLLGARWLLLRLAPSARRVRHG
ncbi:MAG: hypothetical protein C0622_12690 [Desulfuromonas sp.]|nr:MAG: hypothetical protein C0622_12690 [Desulfuromonas sp.]